MKCPFCEGVGGWWESIVLPRDMFSECGVCDATGELSLSKWLHYHFWNNVPVWFIEWYDGRR